MSNPGGEIAPAATLGDLLAIPEEDRRHELVDGVIVEKKAASGEYGLAQHGLSAYVGPFARRPGGRWPGGWWFATEVDVFFDDANTFLPDITGWRRERCPEPPSGTPMTLRPDWVCEILKANRRNDLVKKKRAYHRHKVPH
jgi:Uma2 family endonuclease